jgi:hypothetical protein
MFLAGHQGVVVEQRMRPVTAIDPAHATVRVHAAGDPAALVGRVVTFSNGIARTAHEIKSARREGGDMVLELRDDLLEGVLRVSAVEGDRLLTRTRPSDT